MHLIQNHDLKTEQKKRKRGVYLLRRIATAATAIMMTIITITIAAMYIIGNPADGPGVEDGLAEGLAVAVGATVAVGEATWVGEGLGVVT